MSSQRLHVNLSTTNELTKKGGATTVKAETRLSTDDVVVTIFWIIKCVLYVNFLPELAPLIVPVAHG